jgi:hypothetical protein
MTRGIIRCLVNHPIVGISGMWGPVTAISTDRIVRGTQLESLGLIQRTDDDQRHADGIHKSI